MLKRKCEICHTGHPKEVSYVISETNCNHDSNIGIACASYDDLENMIVKLKLEIKQKNEFIKLNFLQNIVYKL
jgi:hypothetical protein